MKSNVKQVFYLTYITFPLDLRRTMKPNGSDLNSVM